MRLSDSSSWSELSDEQLLALSDDEFDATVPDIADLLSLGPVDIVPEEPPASLWAAIALEVGLDAILSAVPTPDAEPLYRPLGEVQPMERRAPGPAAIKASSRWGGRTAAITLVAACLLLVLVPLGLSRRGGNTEILAAANLEVLDPSATSGHVDLVVKDSTESLELDYAATAPADEYLELWLLAVDDAGEIETLSLGRAEGSGSYEIPADVDRSRFNIVDISIEANDGDESHSGRSILRGQLVS